MRLGETILKNRQIRGLSQEKLAELVGVSRQAVSKWEVGDAIPDTDKLIPLARALGITVDELLQVERIDADKYFEEVCSDAEKLFRDGKRAEIIPLWREAYAVRLLNILA